MKGTPSHGRHNKKVHIRCRRCGRHSYHAQKGRCSACGYPDSKIRNYNWKWKTPLTKKRKK